MEGFKIEALGKRFTDNAGFTKPMKDIFFNEIPLNLRC